MTMEHAPEDMIWITWECEGSSFESHLPRAAAHDRLAELLADELVSKACVEDFTPAP